MFSLRLLHLILESTIKKKYKIFGSEKIIHYTCKPTNRFLLKKMKEEILQKAFILFLEKGFNGTSIAQIQNQAKVSRGAIYHHFKSKEDIYIEVINKYLIPTLSVVTKISSQNKTTLYDTIIASINERKKIIKEIKEIIKEPIIDFNYFKLIYDTCDFYDGFIEKINAINEKEMLEWKKVIKKAIINKEIKEDMNIDFIANNFIILPQGIGLKYSFKGSLNIEELKMMYLNFYNLLKA